MGPYLLVHLYLLTERGLSHPSCDRHLSLLGSVLAESGESDGIVLWFLTHRVIVVFT